MEEARSPGQVVTETAIPSPGSTVSRPRPAVILRPDPSMLPVPGSTIYPRPRPALVPSSDTTVIPNPSSTVISSRDPTVFLDMDPTISGPNLTVIRRPRPAADPIPGPTTIPVPNSTVIQSRSAYFIHPAMIPNHRLAAPFPGPPIVPSTDPTLAPRSVPPVLPSPGPIVEPNTPVQNNTVIWFDPGHLKTVPGIMKTVQITLSLVGFVCIQLSHERSSPFGRMYSVVSMTAICFSGTVLVLYVFHVVEKYQHKVPWLKIEMVFCGLWAALFLMVSCITMAACGNGKFMAAGNIGLKTTAAYGIDFYLKWSAVLRGQLAQEKRIEYQIDRGPATNTPDNIVMYSPLQQRRASVH